MKYFVRDAFVFALLVSVVGVWVWLMVPWMIGQQSQMITQAVHNAIVAGGWTFAGVVGGLTVVLLTDVAVIAIPLVSVFVVFPAARSLPPTRAE